MTKQELIEFLDGIRKYPKREDAIKAKGILERDIKSCMHCRFFHNSRECIANECVKLTENPKPVEGIRESQCLDCPYKQSERYCFPCMKKLLGRTEEM